MRFNLCSFKFNVLFGKYNIVQAYELSIVAARTSGMQHKSTSLAARFIQIIFCLPPMCIILPVANGLKYFWGPNCDSV
jgi:hypothetical protein